MRPLRNFVAPAVGVGALAVGVFVGSSGPAIADTVKEVLVVNSTSQPVPVALQGTAVVKIDPAGNTVTVGNLPTDSQGRLKTVRLGTLTQVSGPFTVLATSGAPIGPKVDTTSCHSVLALVSIDTSGALPPLNPLDLRLEMFEPGGLIVGRVTGTIVNDTVFQGTAAEFVVNGAPVVPPVSQLEYQNHNSVNIKVKGVWLYCGT